MDEVPLARPQAFPGANASSVRSILKPRVVLSRIKVVKTASGLQHFQGYLTGFVLKQRGRRWLQRALPGASIFVVPCDEKDSNAF